MGSGRSLTVTRFITGSAAAIMGTTIGYAILELARRFLQAGTWATVVHYSTSKNGPGLSFDDLELMADSPYSTWAGISLLFRRARISTWNRKNRPYDNRYWSFYIEFFIILTFGAASISFILNRLIDITAMGKPQYTSWTGSTVIGDLNEDDVGRAKVLLNYIEAPNQTWTLTPFGYAGPIAQPIKLKPTSQNFTVHLAEVPEEAIMGQSQPGSFRDSVGDSVANRLQLTPNEIETIQSRNDNPTPGSVYRFSRWGIRIECQKLPDPTVNITPFSSKNLTYAYVSKDVVRGLLQRLQLPDIQYSCIQNFPVANDTLNGGVDLGNVAVVGGWLDNGVGHSFYSCPIDKGDSGRGWVELTIAMVRMNTAFAPNSNFPIYRTDANGKYGYDAAVCVETIQPYLVDVYSPSTGAPTTLRVKVKEDLSSTDLSHGFASGPVDQDLMTQLSSAGKFAAFAAAFDSSHSLIIKDNNRDFWYVPNPTMVSWTDGKGPSNYTSLSADRLADALGASDAAQLLPYLTGSAPLFSQKFQDGTVADASIMWGPTILTCIVILSLGLMAALFVPRLPLGMKRRDFGIFTWLAAFEGQELTYEPKDQPPIERDVTVEELRERYGHCVIRYRS